MHPNRKFRVSDETALSQFVREQGFGLVVASTSEGLRAVHAPLLIDGDRVRFHISKSNLIHPALAGASDALILVNGPHAYVSPDWYGLEDRVPTWNYAAVELEGRARPLDQAALVRLLDEMSDHHEARLSPKPQWNRQKMSEGRFEGLLKAISGFELQITAWRGTFKLDQDKPPEVRSRLADALEENGESGLARLMRP
jgi:transcriptional regulator